MSTEFPEAVRRRAFDFYCRHETVPLTAIANFLGVGRRTFLTLRRRWDWPPRHEAIAAAREAALSPTGDQEPAPAARLRSAAATLAEVTRLRLDALIAGQARLAAPEIDHDRTARALSAYAKTLTVAQSLLRQEGLEPDDGEADAHQPRSLQDLRDELAAHLERLVAEEEARGSDGLLV